MFYFFMFVFVTFLIFYLLHYTISTLQFKYQLHTKKYKKIKDLSENNDEIYANTEKIKSLPKTTKKHECQKKWIREEECRTIFEKLFTGYKFKSVFHKDIINPLTNHLLQLDGYCEELGVAFEYNGSQHYEFTKRFHKCEKDLEYQKYKDKVKYERCKQLGIILIVVPYWVKDMEDFIKKELRNKLQKMQIKKCF